MQEITMLFDIEKDVSVRKKKQDGENLLFKASS